MPGVTGRPALGINSLEDQGTLWVEFVQPEDASSGGLQPEGD